MNPTEMIAELMTVGDFFKVHHKTSFRCWRNEGQEVLVEIEDAGPSKPDVRYSCVATTEDGKMATGNLGPTIEGVLVSLHWYELDKPVRPPVRSAT